MRDEMGAVAMRALILMTTQDCRAAGQDSIEHLPMMGGQPMSSSVGRQTAAQNLSQT